MEISRRAFVRTVAAAGVASVMDAPIQAAQRMAREPARGARALAKRFPDLPRHFAFEYYPWYAASPYPHWDQDGRHPPVDLASNYMARLPVHRRHGAARALDCRKRRRRDQRQLVGARQRRGQDRARSDRERARFRGRCDVAAAHRSGLGVVGDYSS